MFNRISTQKLIALLAATILAMTSVQAQTIWYVDDDAPVGGDGMSWDSAFYRIQPALARAQRGDEIRVAAGVYKPGAIGGSDRTATFSLINGVTLRGGYAGVTEPDPDAWDILQFETVLSGDLAGNDGDLGVDYEENSYHVVTASGCDESTVLEGVTIAGGGANGSGIYARGAGTYLAGGSPTLAACTWRANLAWQHDSDVLCGGGGMYAGDDARPVLTRCRFTGNGAHHFTDYAYAGAVYIEESSPTFIECEFDGNSTDGNHGGGGGGAVHNENGTPAFSDCTFRGNSVDGGYGGALTTRFGTVKFTGCLITENTASNTGGGIWNDFGALLLSGCVLSTNEANGAGGIMNGFGPLSMVDCDLIDNSARTYSAGGLRNHDATVAVIGCRFVGNSAYQAGGAVSNRHTDPLFVNCLFAGNEADDGGGIHAQDDSRPVIIDCTFTGNSGIGSGALNVRYDAGAVLSNCILWGDAQPEISGAPDDVSVSYSNVQGGWPGDGNIDADPLFVDPDGPDDDPNTWEDNDYRLGPGSPCIDAADNTAVPADVADLDGDGDTDERTPFDLDGNPRFADDPDTDDTGVADPPAYPEVVDMGAYEFQVLEVPAFLDIKPGSCPNPLNVKSHGVLPMAICGTADFDAALIDPNSLTLARADGVGGSVTPLMGPPGPGIHIDDVATPFDGEPCDCHDLHGDGIDDLTLKFDTETLVEELELTDLPGRTTLELVVAGELVDGTPFTASDCVRLSPHHAGPAYGRVDFPGGDGSVQPISGDAVSDDDLPPAALSASDDDDDPVPPGRDDDEQARQSPETPLASFLACGPISPALLTLTITGLWLIRVPLSYGRRR